MEQNKGTYRTISCSYYDQLEAYAVRHTQCEIVYQDDQERTVTGTIADIFAKDGAEFLRLDNGTVIRLDRIVSINGQPMQYSC